jgi:pantoate--beta-alanine ligase
VKPDQLFMGQKDFQQCLVVNRLLKLIHSKAELVVCPTLREPDGLAMSSRNLRLNPAERQNALNIYKALIYVKDNIHNSSFSEILGNAVNQLKMNGFDVDYLSLVSVEEDGTVTFPEEMSTRPLYLVVAAKEISSGVRLIDNMQM